MRPERSGLATSKPMKPGVVCAQRLACMTLENNPTTPLDPGGTAAALPSRMV